MIQTHISCNGFQPAARGGTLPQLAEALIRFQENLLRDVFRFRLVGDQTHSRAKYHVLVVLHEHLELLCVCHRLAATLRGLSYV